MRLFPALVITLGILGCVRAQQFDAPPQLDVYAVMDEYNRLGSLDLWPGFDPRRIPVMIFDGVNTVVFNHPSPGSEFTSLSSRQGVWLMQGRHAGVTANSSTKLAGIETATVMLEGSRSSPTVAASLAIHEAFHVFERERHPSWSGNEVELFTFPVTDTAVVAAQRLEAEALRRALATADLPTSACWAASAMRIRNARFASMTAGAAGYERGTELNEGLASYVEKRSIAIPDSQVVSGERFPPQLVRQRAYETGLAIARLLDRFSPDWRSQLEARDSTALDVLLSSALARRATESSGSSCEFTADERQQAQVVAWDDISVLRASRETGRLDFLAQLGWTLVVSSASAPLFPQGFDPWNVHMLTDGEVLHTRYVKVGNDRGVLEVIGRATLTSPAGAHPMFNGIRTVTVAGLPSDLSVTRTTSGVSARAKGLTLELRTVSVDTSGTTITVRLQP